MMDDDKKFTGKIYVACESGTESVRDAYHHVFFKNGYAYATDAHILARVRLSTITQGFDQDELSNLDGKSVHRDVFKQLLKYKHVDIKEDRIEAKFGHHTVSFSLLDEKVVKAPDFDSVIESELTEERTPIKNIGINSEYLNNLAIAMGIFASVKLDFTTIKSKIYVTDTSCVNDALGIIMPTYIEPVLEGFE